MRIAPPPHPTRPHPNPAGLSVGVGFAIPANTVALVVPQLIRDGRVTRASLGVQVGFEWVIGFQFRRLSPSFDFGAPIWCTWGRPAGIGRASFLGAFVVPSIHLLALGLAASQQRIWPVRCGPSLPATCTGALYAPQPKGRPSCTSHPPL